MKKCRLTNEKKKLTFSLPKNEFKIHFLNTNIEKGARVQLQLGE